MIIEAITDSAGLRAFKSQWGALSARAGIHNVFLEWEWLSFWWEQYGAGKRLLVICGIGHGGTVEAIAPLMIRNCRMRGVTLRCVEFIGSGELTPDHLCFICPPHVLPQFSTQVFDYLARMSGDWDAIRLTDMREEDALACAARTVFGPRAVVYARNGVCPYIQLPATWEEYVGTLTSGRRQRIGKYERDLKRNFTVQFSLCDAPLVLTESMARLEDLHTQRMRQKKFDERKATLQGAFWEFQRSFAGSMLEKGRLVMSALRLNGDTAACMYGFVSGGVMSFYLSGIDVRYEKYSVGFVNIINLIREACRRGLGEIDFLRGDEAYKSYFTRSARNNAELIVWRDNFLTGYLRVTDRLISLAKKAAKRLRPVRVPG